MLQKRFARSVVLTVISSLVLAVAAFAADSVTNDQDFGAPGNQNTIDAGAQTRGTAFSVEGSLRLTFAGNQLHLTAGSTVVLELNSTSSSPGVSADDLTFQVPGTWVAGSFVDPNSTSTASYTPAAGESDGVHTLTVQFKCKSGCIDTGAANAQTLNTANARFSVTYSLSTVTPPANTAPVIAFTTSHTSADEGDTKTYNFSISDEAADTHSFVTGYPDCGPGNSLESSSINNTLHTGTFDCFFPDGLVPAQASDVKVKVQDSGTPSLESNELTANTTVSNVDPTVVAGFGTSANCQTAATLNVDPDDLGVNDDDWKVNISWGDGNNEPEITRDNLTSFSATHVYALAGVYNATVTVEDKDGGTGSDLVNSITVNQTYTIDFLAPFDDSSPSGLIVNKMKNGRVVPVKVTLFDDCGLAPVTDPSTIVTIGVGKTTDGSLAGVEADAIESYADAGASSAGSNLFRWSTDGFWIYNLDSKALGLITNSFYRINVYVDGVKATVLNWAILQPVK